ncbi:MAG: cyclase [Acidimicrobiales bacterium]|nr:cyclase [Acidimicrobiales bacterium]
MQIPPETCYTTRSGVSIAYQLFGSGPPLLMAPTIPSHLDLMWVDPSYTQVLRRLGSFATVALFDPRGIGLSDPVDHVLTLEETADDIGAVMDAAGFEQAVVFAASTTCPGAALYAARSPGRVSGLVLWGPWAQGSATEGGPASIVGWDDDMARALDRWSEIVDQEWGTGQTLTLIAPGLATDRRRRAWGMLERASASPASIQAVTQAALEVDLRDVLPLVTAPTVVVQSADGFQPPAIGQHVADLVADGELRVVPPSSEASDLASFFEPVLKIVGHMVTGATGTGATDRVLASVLFTDIVGSTKLASSLGDARWREVLEAHEALLRDLVEAHGGRVVKMIGDGSLSLFDGPVRAARCAAAAVDQVRALGIEVRAGLHTGEVEQVGHDVAGLAVHIAARVEAQAAPGEVWVSAAARDLMVGSGTDLEPRGAYELKGVPGTWELYALGASRPEPVHVAPASRPAASDRLMLAAARRVPGLLRLAGRMTAGRSG